MCLYVYETEKGWLGVEERLNSGSGSMVSTSYASLGKFINSLNLTFLIGKRVSNSQGLGKD